MIWVYRFLLWCLYGPYRLWMMPARLRDQKEDPLRYQEKFGFTTGLRPSSLQKPLLWMHAASVGESVSLLPLITRLHKRFQILLTTGTVTSAEVMKNRLPKDVIHQFAPLDFSPCVERFLTYWQPDYMIWVESELWPNMIIKASERGIPMALVNMRLSQQALASWQRFNSFFMKIMGCFRIVLTQTKGLEKALKQGGLATVSCVGNLKYVRNTPVISRQDSEAMHVICERQHLWMAASTHQGEEAILLAAHDRMIQDGLCATFILAPRHPARRDEVTSLCKAQGLSYQLYSEWVQTKQAITTDVFMIDTIGVLPLFYDISDIVFVGGSLRDGIGGHSILEPLFHGKPTLHGPYMSNFAEVVQETQKAKATHMISSAHDLSSELTTFYHDGGYRAQFEKDARSFSSLTTTILDDILIHLDTHLFREVTR